MLPVVITNKFWPAEVAYVTWEMVAGWQHIVRLSSNNYAVDEGRHKIPQY